jgi:hypothetical protein
MLPSMNARASLTPTTTRSHGTGQAPPRGKDALSPRKGVVQRSTGSNAAPAGIRPKAGSASRGRAARGVVQCTLSIGGHLQGADAVLANVPADASNYRGVVNVLLALQQDAQAYAYGSWPAAVEAAYGHIATLLGADGFDLRLLEDARPGADTLQAIGNAIDDVARRDALRRAAAEDAARQRALLLLAAAPELFLGPAEGPAQGGSDLFVVMKNAKLKEKIPDSVAKAMHGGKQKYLPRWLAYLKGKAKHNPDLAILGDEVYVRLDAIDSDEEAIAAAEAVGRRVIRDKAGHYYGFVTGV